MRISVVILILVGSVSNLFGQHFTFNDDYQEVYSLILDLKFNEASSLLHTIHSSDKENLAPVYLEDLSDFLYIVVTEDQAEFETKKEKKADRLKKLNGLSDNSPYKLLAIGEIHLHWAFSKMRFGEYLSAAREINKSFHALDKNAQKFPDFLPTYKSMGLLHTLIGTVPDNYRWATNLMGVDGTIEEGIREMETVIEKSKGNPEYSNLRKETLFLLSFLHINLLNDKGALVAYTTYVENESGPLMIFAHASLLKEMGQTDQAITILETAPKSLVAFPYLNFLLGELKLARMDSTANEPFSTYLNDFKGSSYVKSAHLKMAWHALLVLEDENQYRNLLDKIGSTGNTMLDEDKSAQKEFESKTVPNIFLLKSRLQFDGGYLQEAWKTLIQAPEGSMKTSDERLEWSYRLARIKQEMGDLQHAISLYAIVVETGLETKRYFGANASLQLGLINEELGNKEAALANFEYCSKFNNSEYRNSINQKAKAGIQRLSD